MRNPRLASGGVHNPICARVAPSSANSSRHSLHVARCLSNIRLSAGSISLYRNETSSSLLSHICVSRPTGFTRSFAKRALHTCIPQLFAKHCETLVQTGFNSTQRAIEKIRDLLERETVVLLQDDCRALLFGQLRHRFSHGAANLVARDEFFDRLGGNVLPGQLDHIDALGRLDDRSAPLAPNPVAAEIERDAI